jgi:RNA polymerase subunit RPABC4/transcription elongation factor Spt4
VNATIFLATGPTSTGSIQNTLQGLIGPLIGCTVAFLVIFWLSLVIWTFRDIRSRSQDMLTQVLATLLVTIFPIVGLFIYMILRPRQTLAEIYERQLEEESLLAEMTERQTCSNCHARIESDFQVCPSCSQKLKRPCPKCERLLELRWSFCPYCATNVASVPGMQSMPPGVQALNRGSNAGIPNGSVPGMPTGGSVGGPAAGNRY